MVGLAVGPGPVQMNRGQPDPVLRLVPGHDLHHGQSGRAEGGALDRGQPRQDRRPADAAAGADVLVRIGILQRRKQREVRLRHFLQGHDLRRHGADIGLKRGQFGIPVQQVLLIDRIGPRQARPGIGQKHLPARQHRQQHRDEGCHPQPGKGGGDGQNQNRHGGNPAPYCKRIPQGMQPAR